jgi:CheY-like chemotaxis protein/HPt (histidine-containing phosphotransfer) domain-containing protein
MDTIRSFPSSEIPLDSETSPVLKHRLSILLVEDVAINRRIAMAQLKFLGHSVDWAGNGRDACMKLSENRFDLVLMDMNLPVMSGAEATRCIREGGLPDFPVLDSQMHITALTANEGEADRNTGVTAGMNGFLTKPPTEKALLAEMAKAAEHQIRRGMNLPLLSAPEIASWTAVASPGTDSKADSSSDRKKVDTKITAMWPDEAARRIKSLRLAMDRGDTEAISLEAHNIKGAAAYLDLQHLKDVASQLEKAADAKQDVTQLTHWSAAVECAIASTLTELKAAS